MEKEEEKCLCFVSIGRLWQRKNRGNRRINWGHPLDSKFLSGSRYRGEWLSTQLLLRFPTLPVSSRSLCFVYSPACAIISLLGLLALLGLLLGAITSCSLLFDALDLLKHESASDSETNKQRGSTIYRLRGGGLVFLPVSDFLVSEDATVGSTDSAVGAEHAAEG